MQKLSSRQQIQQQVSLDGIAVIVNNDNPTDEISSDMVKQIFTGEVTKWQDVK